MEKTEKIRNQLTWKIVFGGMLALGLPAVFFYSAGILYTQSVCGGAPVGAVF